MTEEQDPHVWDGATDDGMKALAALVFRKRRPLEDPSASRYDQLVTLVEASAFAAPELVRDYSYQTGRVPTRAHPLNLAFQHYLDLVDKERNAHE